MAILKDLIVSGSSRLLGKLYTNDIEIGGEINAEGGLHVGKNTAANANIYLNNKLAMRGVDTWLRINDTKAFTNGIYFGSSLVRTDGTLQVGSSGSALNVTTSAATIAVPTTFSYTANTGGNVGLKVNGTATIATGNITTANTNTINNATNIYNKNGTIETDTIKSNKWEIVSTQNLGGDFFVAPTIMVTNGSTFTISSVSGKTITGTLKDTTNITSANFGGHTWSNNSLIKITGKLTTGSTHYILGTCDGKLTAQMNNTANTINFQITCNASTVPPAGTYTITDGTVMMYNVGGSNKVGIYMTCYGTDKYTYIDIYNGSNGNTPVARLGKLDNLKDGSGNRIKVGDILTTDYGLYTSNGFFEGKVVANGGTIAGWTIGDGYITTNSNRTTYDNTSYTGMTMTASGIGARGSATSYFNLSTGGGLTAVGATVTGVITANTGYIGGTSGWTIAAQQLYSGTIGADNSLHLGTKNLGNNTSVGGRSGSDWRLTVGQHFGVTNTGALYCNDIHAAGGTIAGWHIDTNKIYSGNHSTWDSTNEDGLYLGPDGIAGGSGGIWYLWKDGSAKIGAMTLTAAGVLTVPAANVSGKLTAATIDGDKITANTITAGQIATNAITADELAANAVTADKIAAGAIAIGKLDSTTQTKFNNVVKQSIESIIGTQTSNTYSWTGTSTTLSASDIVDGLTINYFLPYSVGGSQVGATYLRLSDNANVNTNGVVLNLTLADGTTTGNIPVWYQGVGRLTSHYGYGAIIKMTYHKDVVMANAYKATGWWVDAQYNSDTVDNRIVYFTGKTGAKGIWAGSLFMEDSAGTYQNICTASDGTVTTASSGNGARTTATTKKANTNGFKVGGTIYYTGTSYNADTNITGTNTIFSSYGNVFDSRYCMNTTLTAGSLTTYKPWYLVGSISTTDGLFYLDSTWWTQTPNTTGKVYILGGGVYDSTTSYCRITLYENNMWYVYDGTRLVPYEKYASQTATNYITYINATDGIKIHNSNDDTDYLQVNSTAIKMYRNNVQKMYLDDSKLQFTNGSTVLSQLDATSQKFYDTSGNITAEFGANSASIGKTTGTSPNIILASSTGISLRSGGTTLANYTGSTITLGQTTGQAAVINSDGMQIYKGGNKVADFGGDLITIGKTAGGHITLDNDSMDIYNIYGSSVFKVAEFGDTIKLGTGKNRTEVSSGELSMYYLHDYVAPISLYINHAPFDSEGNAGNIVPEISLSGFDVDDNLEVDGEITECYITPYFVRCNKFMNNSDNSIYQLYRGNNPSPFYIYGNDKIITRIATKTSTRENPSTSFMIGNGNYAAGSSTNGTIANNNIDMYLCGGTDTTAKYIQSYPVYNRTYNYGANMYVTSNGVFGRSTSSSIRYKHDVEYYTNKDNSTISESKILVTKKKVKENPESILDIPIVTFKYNEGYVNGEADFDYDKPILGLIAEDVAKICPECATYIEDDDGNKIPEAWDEKAVLVRLLYVVQKQNKMIEELQKEVHKWQ